MASTKNAVSARERARAANAARLAAEQERLKKNEDDLVSFFKAQETVDKAKADADARIERIRAELADKIADSANASAAALAELKGRGENVASIAELTGLSRAEVNKHLKSLKDQPRSKPEPETTAATAQAS